MTNFFDPNHKGINQAQFNTQKDGQKKPEEAADAAPAQSPTDPYAQHRLPADKMFEIMNQFGKSNFTSIEFPNISNAMVTFSGQFPPGRFDQEIQAFKSAISDSFGSIDPDLATQLAEDAWLDYHIGRPVITLPGQA